MSSFVRQFLVLAAAMAAVVPRAKEPRSSSEVPVAKPTPLPFPIEAGVGTFSHKIVNFVRKNLTFGAAKGYPIGDGSCEIYISPVVGSSSVPRHKDPDPGAENGYIVAIITNPKGCKIPWFDLGKADTAAWAVRFYNTQDVVNPHVPTALPGVAGVVKLGRGLRGDEWLTSAFGWGLAQCGHDNTTSPGDNALIVPRKDDCKIPTLYGHQADAVSRALIDSAKTRRGFTDEPIALWFACGTDCCYSDSQ